MGMTMLKPQSHLFPLAVALFLFFFSYGVISLACLFFGGFIRPLDQEGFVRWLPGVLVVSLAGSGAITWELRLRMRKGPQR